MAYFRKTKDIVQVCFNDIDIHGLSVGGYLDASVTPGEPSHGGPRPYPGSPPDAEPDFDTLVIEEVYDANGNEVPKSEWPDPAVVATHLADNDEAVERMKEEACCDACFEDDRY